MAEKVEGPKLEMPKFGILRGVSAEDIEVIGEKVVSMRIRAKPYSNTYSVDQLSALRKIAEKYGSGKMHLSPRHNFEIPEIREKSIDKALEEQYKSGVWCGGAGTSVRNIFSCPEWCGLQVLPVRELSRVISMEHGDKPMPNKVTISLSACPNSCGRSRTVDIGAVAVAKLRISRNKCTAPECDLCLKECKVGAINLDDKISIDEDKCVECGLCAKVCEPDAITITEKGFKVFIGGKEGREPRFGDPYAEFVDEWSLLGIVGKVLDRYEDLAENKNKKKKERLGEVIDRVGLEAFMA